MRSKQHGLAAILQLKNEVANVMRARRIYTRGGLIENDQLWILDERLSRNLFVSIPRILANPAISGFFKSDESQEFCNPREWPASWPQSLP